MATTTVRRTLFQATVARLDSQGSWWLMNTPEKGWASFGYRYASLGEITDRWNVRLGEPSKDSCSVFVPVDPAPEKRSGAASV